MSIKRSFTLVLTLLWFAVSFAQVGLTQPIVLECDSQPLKQVFAEITKQTGLIFTYGNFNDSQKVTIKADRKLIKEVLTLLAVEVNADFVIRDKYIIVRPREISSKKERDISGRIWDQNTGEPISKASIYIKSSKLLINTDEGGRFNMKLKTEKPWLTLSVAKVNYLDTTVVIGMQDKGPVNIYLKGFPSRSIEELYPLERKEVTLNAVDTVYPKSELLTKEKVNEGFWEQLAIEKPDFGNIREDFFTAVSFSFIPPISTNKMLSYHTSNNLSINVIGGTSAGLNGLEMAGVYNYTRGNVNGIQLAGVVNRVAGHHSGLQMAGVLNSNSGNTEGLQASGFINYSDDTLKGIQLAGFYQKAGFATGLQAAGFYNKADTLVGAQLAGFYNETKVLKGAQISGFLNYTDTLQGIQIGLVNVSKYTKAGFGLGLINYSGNGYHKIELATNSEHTYQLGFRSGWPLLYLHYFGGINNRIKDSTFLQAGFGLASSLKLNNSFALELDANMRTQRVAQDIGNWQFNFHNQALIGLSWQPFKKLGIKAGLTLNHFWYDAGDSANLSYLSITGKSIYKYNDSDYDHKLWWGWQISVMFF